jgi:beta-lactamase class A
LASVCRRRDTDGLAAVAVAVLDQQTGVRFGFQEDRLFHSASTIKLAVLLAVYRALETGKVQARDRLHVRNRFLSQVDGAPYHLRLSRDGEPHLYQFIGRTQNILALAEMMIVRSSNLATNLLLDYLGVEFVSHELRRAGLEDMHCVRGVEDEMAYERGINNQVTAAALLRFFQKLEDGELLGDDARRQVDDILLGQEFNNMIPAGLPAGSGAKVAHKTGEISTVCHDAGVVMLPGRKPYMLVILTEFPPNVATADARRETVAALSRDVYQYLRSAEGLVGISPPVPAAATTGR